MTRIALIHATEVARVPAQAAFAEHWPAAEIVNLLDDSLTVDSEKGGSQMASALKRRMAALADYALQAGASGILYTCSSFGEAIDAVAQAASVPVLKPNEAMFRAAIRLGKRFGMLTTFEPAGSPMEREFYAMAKQSGSAGVLDTYFVPNALQALKTGDTATHDRLIAEAAEQFRDRDAILLAQFSNARAAAAISRAIDIPVLSSPASAVIELKRTLDKRT
jgi:Asp/Glu/hydantoin racemase